MLCRHPHQIFGAVPDSQDGLRRAIGEAHRRYTRRVNFREKWRGHLWQGRFASFVLDDYHLFAATRYVERNPVRAGLVDRPEDYHWSSAAAHLAGQDDRLVKVAPLLAMMVDWPRFLSEPTADDIQSRLQRHERTGRPLGHQGFLARLETILNRTLKPQKPGPKPKEADK